MEFKKEDHSDIIKFLDDFGVKYKFKNHIIQNTVTWSRSVNSFLVRDDGQVF